MRKLIYSLLAIIMVVGFSNKAEAQVALTGNTAGAELVQVLTIVNTTPLHFGTIGITGSTAGSVVMGTDGTRVAGETTTTLINTGTQRTVALFTLTGTASAAYTIALPATIALTTATGTGTQSITVGTLRINESGSEVAHAASIVGNLDVSGDASFLLAGTLPIVADQAIGIYSGTYDVTVDYQ